MDEITSLLLRLVRSVLNNTDLGQAELSEDVLARLYTVSKRQEMTHLAADGLMRAGLLPAGQLGAKFRKQRMAAIFSDETKVREVASLCECLSSARVDHIPLKGSVLRESYPEPWMRTRCDIDLLVRSEQLTEACEALESAGCVRGNKGPHDVAFTTPDGIHLELHFILVSKEEKINLDQVEDVWEHATPINEGSYTYKMDDAMFYAYHVSHMAKHLRISGCGLRPFIDLWVLDSIPGCDREARRRQLEKGGLQTFADAASEMADCWMNGR